MGRVGKVSFLDGNTINDKRKLEESTLESFGLDNLRQPNLYTSGASTFVPKVIRGIRSLKNLDM